MFEWWYSFWKWLGYMIISGKIFEPYQNIGFWFNVIVIVGVVVYALIVLQYWNWFTKVDIVDEVKE